MGHNLVEHRGKHSKTEVGATLLAGLIAISFNTILLKAAPLFGIVAEKGGLLRLLAIYLGPPANRFGVAQWWTRTGLPGPASLSFWLVFHYGTGLVMAFLYASFLESRLPGGVFIKGSLFSLLPWLISALLVLPLLGQGPLGLRAIPLSAALYFLLANWVFGVTLAVFDDKFRSGVWR
jgi:hypothetical protein